MLFRSFKQHLVFGIGVLVCMEKEVTVKRVVRKNVPLLSISMSFLTLSLNISMKRYADDGRQNGFNGI